MVSVEHWLITWFITFDLNLDIFIDVLNVLKLCHRQEKPQDATISVYTEREKANVSCVQRHVKKSGLMGLICFSLVLCHSGVFCG